MGAEGSFSEPEAGDWEKQEAARPPLAACDMESPSSLRTWLLSLCPLDFQLQKGGGVIQFTAVLLVLGTVCAQ